MTIRPFPPPDSDLIPISSIGETLHVLHTILHRTALHGLPHASRLEPICIYLHLTDAYGSARAVMDSHSTVTHMDFLCQPYQRSWLDEDLASPPPESSLPEDSQDIATGHMRRECDGCALCAPCKTPLTDNSDGQSADYDGGDREKCKDCERQEDSRRSHDACAPPPPMLVLTTTTHDASLLSSIEGMAAAKGWRVDLMLRLNSRWPRLSNGRLISFAEGTHGHVSVAFEMDGAVFGDAGERLRVRDRIWDAWRSVKEGGVCVLVGYRRGLDGREDDFVRVKEMLDGLMSEVGIRERAVVGKEVAWDQVVDDGFTGLKSIVWGDQGAEDQEWMRSGRAVVAAFGWKGDEKCKGMDAEGNILL